MGAITTYRKVLDNTDPALLVSHAGDDIRLDPRLPIVTGSGAGSPGLQELAVLSGRSISVLAAELLGQQMGDRIPTT